MVLEDYYRLSIGDGIQLRKEIEKTGELLKEEFIPDYYRYVNLYKYNGNIYYIDHYLGIIDIKEA